MIIIFNGNVNFYLFDGLEEVIYFLSEEEVVFPHSKLVIFGPYKTFYVDLLVFHHQITGKSENNFLRTVVIETNEP